MIMEMCYYWRGYWTPGYAGSSNAHILAYIDINDGWMVRLMLWQLFRQNNIWQCFYVALILFSCSPYITEIVWLKFINVVAYLQQNNLFKVREGKYQARINALETLVAGTTEENEVPSILMDLDTHSPIIRA